MAERPARSRPPSHSNITEFDRFLTRCKDERTPVDILMVDTGHRTSFRNCMIVTADRYMIQVRMKEIRHPFWINKAYIFAVEPPL